MSVDCGAEKRDSNDCDDGDNSDELQWEIVTNYHLIVTLTGYSNDGDDDECLLIIVMILGGD